MPTAAETPNPRVFVLTGGAHGAWRVTSHRTLRGPSWPAVERVDMVAGHAVRPAGDPAWTLSGVTTHDRYTNRPEKQVLVERQQPIGRPEATRAALMLLRKRPDWWALSQDERREILEERSHHIAIGMDYLPAIARRLLHCRDLAIEPPFDFLGFLDFAPEHEAAFDELLARLRASAEWQFMDRDIEIRLSR